MKAPDAGLSGGLLSKSMYDSAECYRRYLDGDEGAAAQLMEDVFFGLVYFVDGYVHDVHTAEDIAMDVMAELFSRRRKYDSRSSLKTFIYMLGKSRALDHLKRRKRVEFAPIEAADGVSDERAQLEDKIVASERERAVREAVRKLPDDMREAVHLIYFEELSYDEAARVMRKNRKQVDNLLYRAKKELREIIGEGGRELLCRN